MGVDMPQGTLRRSRRSWPRPPASPSGKSIDERFAYLYSEAELEHWAVRIRELAGRAEVTHVLFNNCCRDNAQRNAARFRALVEEAGEPGGQDGQGEIWTAGRLRGTAT
ncbi:DUF72 domain-containing protein [Streptosporangium sp. NPDC002544]|uniref:DUF72 domain-containing protein n=1 Tax=Streptosporangium sp. NPDC002544 TaxID=3154538 RepID=UPI00332CD2D0